MLKQAFLILLATIILTLSFLIGRVLGTRTEMVDITESVEVVRQVLPQKIVSEYSFQRLNADVSGEVTALGDNYITVKSLNGTVFNAYNEPQGITTVVNSQNETVAFENITIGDKLSGGISIVTNEDLTVGSTGSRQPGDIILHYIQITK